MNIRRFEHPGKNRFWEVYWDGGDVEIISGVIGTKGRATRHHGGAAVIDFEIKRRLKEGFIEVRPETAESAPQAVAAPEWIARIAEAFDDDALRLVFADWLQQQGDPLGELIMLQCERARLERWDPRQKAMREREEHMIALYRPRWLPNLASANVDFTRGFVERIRIAYPFDRVMFDRLLDVTPLARTLEISNEAMYGAGMPPEALDQLPLARFTGLYFRGVQLTAAHVERVIDPLGSIDRLGFAGANLGGGDLKALGRRLFRELDLHQNALGARGVAHALGSQNTLEDLDLGNAGIGDDGAILIARTTCAKLERLWLRRSNLTARSLAWFAKSTALENLRVLELSGNGLDAAAVDALCAANFPALRELDLSACSLDDAAVTALCKSRLLKQLAWLDLGHNVIGLAGAKALASVELPALRFLDISGNPMPAEMKAVKLAHPHARVVARAR